MYMRRFFTFLFAVSSVISINATPVDLKQAENVALSFMNSNFPQTRAKQIELVPVWSDVTMTKSTAETKASFYVFNLTDKKGFIAIAGDDNVYPILGYSMQYPFKADSMPPNLKAWFEGYRQQISWVRKNTSSVSKKVKEAWSNLRNASYQLKADGVQLTTVLWDQMAPYNNLCPSVNGEKTPTGCVATSTAIAMQYHKWPDVGQDSHTYTSTTYGFTLSATFDTPYAWDNMPATYTAGEYTSEQAQNVATLMYDCGVFSNMDYAPDNSGALTLTAAQGLVNYMKYDKSLQVLQRNGYQDTEWENIIKNELNNNRPVVYAGQNDKQEGHQFILDGYNESNYFHVNWGWSGLANGFYLLSVLEPEVQGTGGNSGGGFSVNQSAMISLKKAEANSSYQDVLYLFAGESDGEIFNGLSTTTSPIISNTEFMVKAGFIGNFSIRDFTGTIALALVDQSGNTKQFISPQETLTALEIDNGTAGEFPCIITTNIASTDRIRLMYKSSDSDNWKWVRKSGNTTDEIVISNPTSTDKIENDLNISIASDGEGNIAVNSPSVIHEVTLYDTNGRMLNKQEGINSRTVSLSYTQYPQDIYILHIFTADGRISHKIVKN